ALVIEGRVATSAGTWYQGGSLDATRFGVYGTSAAGVPLEKVENAIDAVIAGLIEKGPSAEEVERAKSRMVADFVFAQDNQSTLARLYGAALAAWAIAGAAPASAASKIEEIVSPGGIKAWLVRETSVPIVALDFAFAGGANADPTDKPGVAYMVGSMLDEGAGDLDA